MPRTSFLFGVLAALGAQLLAPRGSVSAQDFVWTGDRPDGVAPTGIFADRVLPEGVFEIRPSFTSFDFEGTRFGSDFISFDELLDVFDIVPFEMSTRNVLLNASYGVSDRVTLVARFGWTEIERDQVTGDLDIFTLDNDGITDTEVHLLYEAYRQGPWRAHLQAGVSIPTGEVDDEGDAPGFRSLGILPYDMQIGTGVFGIVPGATVQAMNEHGSVGLQLLGRIFVGENDRNWRPGHAAEVNGWAAYKFNRFFSVSSGLRARTWAPIEGFDESLDPGRDPGEDPLSFGGERVDVPLGINLYVAEGPLAGQRFAVEFLFNVHEELDGPWLAADQGFTVSWTGSF